MIPVIVDEIFTTDLVAGYSSYFVCFLIRNKFALQLPGLVAFGTIE